MKISITANEFKALAACAGKKDVRYYLNGIYIDAEQKSAVATDGHHLIKVPCTNLESGEQESFIFELPPKLPPVKCHAVIVESVDDKTALVKYAGAATSYTVNKIDGHYPDYKSLLDQKQKQQTVTALAINPALPASVCKALKVDYVQFDITDSSQMLWCRFINNSSTGYVYEGVTYVLMPVRMP